MTLTRVNILYNISDKQAENRTENKPAVASLTHPSAPPFLLLCFYTVF